MSLSANFPAIRPSLLLDFANVGALDPRITFTRASTGTYYDGVTTAKAEENLLTYSQEFDNAAWVKTNATVTANSTVAPDGTTTADTATASATTGLHTISQANLNTAGLIYTFSVFAKAGTNNFVQLLFSSGTHGSLSFANFDLSSGVLGTVGASAIATITPVGSGWYRCSVTATAISTSTGYPNIVLITSASASRAESWTATGTETVYLWGAQVEQRSSVTAYTPTTTQPIVNYIPVLQTAASGVARFDHNPTTGEALGLLIEEQRTNLLTYSSDFSNAAWFKTRVSITADTIVAPDGTLTGDKLVVDTTASTNHTIGQNYSVTSGTTYTWTVYAKAAEITEINMRFSAQVPAGNTIFNLSAGTVSNFGTVTAASITSIGNGWYRCSFTQTASSSGLATAQIFLAVNGSITLTTANGYDGAYIWGAQLEVGAFPTSAIQTTSAQVTRQADAASMTGTNFSSWYNAGEGTVYAEAQYISSGTPPANQITFAVTDSSATNYINARRSSSSGNTVSDIFYSGASQASLLYGSFANSVAFKLSVAYAVNNFAACGNSGSVATDTSGNVPVNVSTMYIGCAGTNSQVINGHIRKLSYYPQRLSDANLQALTS